MPTWLQVPEQRATVFLFQSAVHLEQRNGVPFTVMRRVNHSILPATFLYSTVQYTVTQWRRNPAGTCGAPLVASATTNYLGVL